MQNVFPYRLAALGAALLALAACHKSGVPSPKERTVTIESDPPGCEMYLDGALLGTTPCEMNEVRLNELGLKWPEYVHKDDALSMTWTWDNTGIIMQLGDDETARRKLFFKPPDRMVPGLDMAATPWGGMALLRQLDRSIADDNHLAYRAVCRFSQSPDRLSIALALPAGGVIRPGAKCTASLVLRNQSSSNFACFRPGVDLFCDRLDAQTQQHAAAHGAPQDSWLFLKPGETASATVDFTAPTNPGDYCVSAVATLHREPTGENAYGAVYSNGGLLRVQR